MPFININRMDLVVVRFILVLFSLSSIEATVNLFLNGTQIDENFSEHTLQSGDNFIITCEGNSPLQWKIPNVRDKEYEEYTRMSISNENSTLKTHNKYVSTLEIFNITFPYVGLYRCFEDINKVNSKQVYLYVYDDDHLAVVETKAEHEIIYSVKYARTVIPCKPTSPDVDVTLKEPGGSVVELNTTEACEYSFDYNPYEGFFTAATSEDYCLLYCYFSRNYSYYEYWFKLDIEPATSYLAVPFIGTNKRHFVIGDNLSLECSVKSDVQTDIQWKFPIDKNNVIQIDDSIERGEGRMVKSRLKITNITLKNEGDYRCLAQDKQNHSSETEIKIFVHDVDDNFIILSSPNNSEYTENKIGETVIWNVPFEAYPQSRATWFDNKGKPIISRHTDKYNMLISQTNAFLSVKNLTYKDHGTYELVINNSKNNRTQSKLLNVTGKPEINLVVDGFQLPLRNTSVICEVVANPKAVVSVEYKRDTGEFEKLQTEAVRKFGLQVVNGVKVSFNKSTIVKCTAENVFGVSEAEKEVYISDVPGGFEIKLNTAEAYFSESTNEASVASGGSLTLNCSTFIKNKQERSEWRKGNRRITANKTFTLLKQQLPSRIDLDLIISNIRDMDQGNYTCALVDTETVIKEEQISIVVSEPCPPRIESNTNGTLLKNLGHYITFECKLFGLPKPKITWFKDDEDIEGSSSDLHFNPDKTSLTINSIKLQDEGEYKCVAENKLGTASKTWSLEIKDKPSSQIYYWLVIILLIILVIITSVIVYLKDHRKKKLEKLLKEVGLAYFEQGQLENLNPELGLEDQVELLPYDRRWEFPPEDLKIGKQLGAGAFGVVMKGEAKGIIPGEERTTVAVKMVKKDAGHTYIKALASELKIMVHLGNHLNVVNLLGACTKNVAKGQLFVIVEYCKFGNTHNYLYRHRNDFIDQVDRNTGVIDFNIGNERLERSYSVVSNKSFFPMKYVTQLSVKSANAAKYSIKEGNEEDNPEECKIISMCPKVEEGEDEILLSNNSSIQPEWRTNYRGDYKGSVRPICTKDLLIWAFQVAKGMDYLASRKVLHGDLAARNILLADCNVVKICDFGLAKSMYKNENYKKNSDCPLPIKWMAIESIRDRIFSTQSDVWSFGIVLWEFFSLARTPYPGMEADERLYTKLVEGYRMEAPEYATDEIYKIILECWSQNPLRRPSFRNLEERLGNIIGEQMRQYYIDLNDPYLRCNVQRRESGLDDYLERVNTPTFENLTSPQLYVNQMDHSPGYLSMRSPCINSPRDEDNKFNFETKPKKKISVVSFKDNLIDDVFVGSEEDQDVEKKSEGNHDFTNPSYIYPQSRGSTSSDVRVSLDKYIVMEQKGTSNPSVRIKEDCKEILYINDLSTGVKPVELVD